MNVKVRALLLMAVKQSGSYNPDHTLFLIEEQLTGAEAADAEQFLRWCDANKHTFGSGNIHQLYRRWKATVKA